MPQDYQLFSSSIDGLRIVKKRINRESRTRTQLLWICGDHCATKADLHTFEKGSAGFVWWLGQWNSFRWALLRKHPSIIYSNLLNFQVEISFVRSAKNSSPWIKVSVGYHLGTRVLFFSLWLDPVWAKLFGCGTLFVSFTCRFNFFLSFWCPLCWNEYLRGIHALPLGGGQI